MVEIYECPLLMVVFLPMKLTSLEAPRRQHVTDIMSQLDGPTSVHARRRPEQKFVQRTATMPRGGYRDESDSDSHDNRRSHNEQRHF